MNLRGWAIDAKFHSEEGWSRVQSRGPAPHSPLLLPVGGEAVGALDQLPRWDRGYVLSRVCHLLSKFPPLTLRGRPSSGEWLLGATTEIQILNGDSYRFLIKFYAPGPAASRGSPRSS